uniref:Phosphoglycerate mutase n=1 Tax=Panagrolaimus davidi TaxID=227884 RepID=A0A914P3Y2_9BILA
MFLWGSEYNLVDTEYEPVLKQYLPEKDEYTCEKRIRQTIESILDRYPGNILIVSHGSPTAAIHTVLGHEHREIGYCAVSKFVATPLHKTDMETIKDNLGFKYSFDCQLAGDLSHISDPTNMSINRL